MSKPKIRWLIRRDMLQVLDIERESFEHPWGEDDFLEFLRRENSIGMVAERDKIIFGFVLYGVHEERFEIVNLAVHNDNRRQGIGTDLVQHILGKCGRPYTHLPTGNTLVRTEVLARVRETNRVMTGFMQACGFRARLEPGYYRDPDEDAYVFTRRVKECESVSV